MSAVLQRGFVLAEDEALKAKLSDVMLADGQGGDAKRVKTFFKLPVGETIREYPAIVLSLVDIVFASDRNHSSEVILADYWPSNYPTIAEYLTAKGIPYDSTKQTPMATRWQPYDLIYQVETLCRNARHDREITAKLMDTAFLPRNNWGYLDVPQDGSSRWLDFLGWSQADYLEGSPASNNRVFRKIYNVSVSAHFPPENPFVFYDVLNVAGILTSDGTSADPGWTNS